MTQKFKVGDKVRILDANKIFGPGITLVNGDIFEITGIGSLPDMYETTRVTDGKYLGIIPNEVKYIEKVADEMAKFKVGDKVRVIAEHFKFAKGETFVIASIDADGDLFDINGTCVMPSKVEKVNAKPTRDKPTKKQRLSALERQVAELQAEVASLKAQPKPTEIAEMFAQAQLKAKQAHKTSNEQRKAIIAEAKAFVEGAKNFTGSLTGRKGYRYASTGRIVCDVEFIVDAKKRTVVALLKEQMGAKNVRAKGIAKCAPDDIFNSDIGKAIALGRALGLDVERFEQAVKPTEVVVGTKVSDEDTIMTVKELIERPYDALLTTGEKVSGQAFYAKGAFGWVAQSQVTIIDDTDAQY